MKTTDRVAPLEPESIRDHLEAQARRRMAALTPTRGFDSRRQRDDELAQIDALLDDYNQAR